MPQASFQSPNEATEALVAALQPLDRARLADIFGSGSDDLIESGDDAADRQNAEKFVSLYRQKHELIAENDATVLQVGPEDWPFPVPLIETEDGWQFDTEAGKEEILNRRVGENELDTIQTCLAVVDAQREYAALDPDKDGMRNYATKFISDPGKRNGLYWKTPEGEPLSPLGPLVAEASREGYRRAGVNVPIPYHGYYYRLLTAQGNHAGGGAYDYMVSEKLIGGFALVAWPARYGNSGIMTFITNHDGVVYQKDLGHATAAIAEAMNRFDPDTTWTRVEDVD